MTFKGYPEETLDGEEDDGTMPSNVNDFTEAVVGHKIKAVVKAGPNPESSYLGSICPQCDADCIPSQSNLLSETLPRGETGFGNMSNILEDAQAAVYGPREHDYGHPRDNFKRTADLWNAYLSPKLFGKEKLSDEDVANLMILLKVARLQNGYHRDSVVDVAGYAGTLERLQEPGANRATAAPRSWTASIDIPRGVEVWDSTGDLWKWIDGRFKCFLHGRWSPGISLTDPETLDWHDVEYGAYVEVIK